MKEDPVKVTTVSRMKMVVNCGFFEKEKERQMNDSKNDVKPRISDCRFCGSNFVEMKETHVGNWIKSTRYAVCCENCGASGPKMLSDIEAAMIWRNLKQVDSTQQYFKSRSIPYSCSECGIHIDASGVHGGDIYCLCVECTLRVLEEYEELREAVDGAFCHLVGSSGSNPEAAYAYLYHACGYTDNPEKSHGVAPDPDKVGTHHFPKAILDKWKGDQDSK